MKNKPRRKTPAEYDYTMKKTLKASRGTEIDTRVCADKVGGNQFELVIIAANRAREMMYQNKDKSKFIKGTVEALIEIQEGKVGHEYLYKFAKK